MLGTEADWRALIQKLEDIKKVSVMMVIMWKAEMTMMMMTMMLILLRSG